MRLNVVVVAMAAVLFAGGGAWAQEAPDAQPQSDNAWAKSLHPVTGTVPISQAGATLNLGTDYYFLDSDDARKVLVDGWRNPPETADGVIGMVFPANMSPTDERAWGAVVTYQDDGYVSDKDAHKIKYDKLLKQMQAGEDEDNKAREKAGFPTVHLVGWAEQPTYDASRHLLIWARDLQFGGGEEDTLNYDVRVLGRRGVLSLNMVAGMNDLPAIRESATALAQTAVFDEGSRYADFVKGEDKVAEYGLAGLVAAGALGVAAKKVGLLAALVLIFKKAAVFIVAGLAASWRWLKGLFGKKA